MTPLEAAREMMQNPPMVAAGKLAMQGVCALCWLAGRHDEDCPGLLLPQIVAALEWLERISRGEHEDGCLVPTTILMSCTCHQRMALLALGMKETVA